MANTKVTCGVGKKISANKFTKSGYIFKNWTVYRDYDNKWSYTNYSTNKTAWYTKGEQPAGYQLTKYKDQATISKTAPSGTITFYAQWAKKA